MTQGLLNRCEYTPHIYRQRLLEFLGRKVCNRTQSQHSCVVHQNVYLAEFLGRLLHRSPYSGLIRSEKKGRVRTCRLQPGVLASAEQWLMDRRSEWEIRHDRFEEYVMQLKDKEKDDDRQA